MIRLIVALIGLFLLWLWMVSPFTKRTKSIATFVALSAAIALVAFETYDNKPRHGLISASQITLCGLSVSHSYRSDYKTVLCMENTTASTVKRMTFKVVAKRCGVNSQCEDLESVSRDRMITIAPLSKIDLHETVRFESILADDQSITWSADIIAVKAVP